MAYLGIFLFIFFYKDIDVKIVLWLDLGFRMTLLVVYLITVVSLQGKLKHFMASEMQGEIKSIKV